MAILKWRLEDDVDDYVKTILESLGLKKLIDYNVKSGMSDYMKESLKGSAKTKKKQISIYLMYILKSIKYLLLLRISLELIS